MLEKTAYSRKLDSQGRLVIPTKLRDMLRIEVGKDYDFYLHEETGVQYLCIPVGLTEIERAKQLLGLTDC